MECLFISFEFFTKILLCFPSLSCKWVGLFVILWAGITTVLNLWDLLGDLSLSLVSIIACLLYLFNKYKLVIIWCDLNIDKNLSDLCDSNLLWCKGGVSK